MLRCFDLIQANLTLRTNARPHETRVLEPKENVADIFWLSFQSRGSPSETVHLSAAYQFQVTNYKKQHSQG
eukprot:2320071-Amphidinium_carterae.1